MKRLVVIADNPLIVGAIRSGMRDQGVFELLGYLDARKASAAMILDARADLVLVDEGDHSDESIALIRGLKEQDEDLTIIVLSVRLEGDWLSRAFEAGATGAISKAIQPVALATLVREAMHGHIVAAPRFQATDSSTRFANGPIEDGSSLTARELEILRFVASGATNSNIARQLWITQQTVKFHVSNIYRKLGVSNRTEACHYAHVYGLVTPPPVPLHVVADATKPLSVAL